MHPRSTQTRLQVTQVADKLVSVEYRCKRNLFFTTHPLTVPFEFHRMCYEQGFCGQTALYQVSFLPVQTDYSTSHLYNDGKTLNKKCSPFLNWANLKWQQQVARGRFSGILTAFEIHMAVASRTTQQLFLPHIPFPSSGNHIHILLWRTTIFPILK